MSNESRSGWLAAFFVLGMAFMLVVIALTKPAFLFNNEQAKIMKVDSPLVATGSGPAPTRQAPEPTPTPEEVETEREPVLPEAQPVAPPVNVEEPPTVEDAPPAPVVRQPAVVTRPIHQGIAPVAVTMRKGGSGIAGRAILVGTAPPERIIPMDPACGKLAGPAPTTRFYQVDERGGLADVVIALAEEPHNARGRAMQNVVIDNVNCFFEPQVSVAQVGQTILISNSDPVLHNAHVVPTVRGNREINLAMLPNGKPAELKFREPENFIRIKCDVHPWMFAYVSVFSHPWATVTRKSGAFGMPLPPGEHTIIATHRKAGSITNTVRVTRDEYPEIEFRFQAPAELARN